MPVFAAGDPLLYFHMVGNRHTYHLGDLDCARTIIPKEESEAGKPAPKAKNGPGKRVKAKPAPKAKRAKGNNED